MREETLKLLSLSADGGYMAITLRVPSSGSQTTVSGSLPNSTCRDVWLGFTTPPTSSGSVTYFWGASEVAGSIMMSIVSSPMTFTLFPYPIHQAQSLGIFAGCISGGSAFWMFGNQNK